MPVDPKNGKLLWHLTALDNMPSILKKGLCSRNSVNDFVDVADQDIIGHRETYNLNDFIPFHFFPKTPFAGIVQKNYPDKEFVYITIHRIYAKKNEYKIILRHPLALDKMVLHDFKVGMALLDWPLMARRDYTDDDCKCVCLAECVTDREIKPSEFYAVYVRSSEAKTKVQKWCLDILGNSPMFHLNITPGVFVK